MLNRADSGNRYTTLDASTGNVENRNLLISLSVYDERKLLPIRRPRSRRADETQGIEFSRCAHIGKFFYRLTRSGIGDIQIESEQATRSEERDVSPIGADLGRNTHITIALHGKKRRSRLRWLRSV